MDTLVYVVYSKSKIHGVYTTKTQAEFVLDSLTQRGGFTDLGIAKRMYYISNYILLNQNPK